jgi:hypothetical protein
MAETEPDLTGRVESLETGQSKILGKLDELIGGGHAKAEAHEERRLDRPSTIEEQVRAELDRKDREARTAAEKDAEKSERDTMRETLAKLTEAAPVQPQPRRQRVMWGKR